MSEKKTNKTIKKKKESFISQHMTAIINIVLFGTLGLILLWTFCSKHIIAFFSPTPQHKCEASLPTYASNIYCKEDGTQGNKKQDECQEKAPDYVWTTDKDGLGECKKLETFPEKSTNNTTETRNKGYTCTDATSYDYNWDNDMYCTAPDGTHFYTSYENAELLTQPDPYERLLEQYEGYEDYDQYELDY